MSIAAIVLAAGASYRLGRPKQLISIRGRSLIENVVDEVQASRCDAVAVILGASVEDIAPVLTGRPITLLLNPAWGEGIAASIRVGVRWAAPSHDAVLICVCDQPYLRATHLDRLIKAHRASGHTAASRYGGALGVPAVFGHEAFPYLTSLRGDAGARNVIGSNAVAIDWPEGAFDLDVPADLAALQRA